LNVTAQNGRAGEPGAQGPTFREHIIAEAVRRPELRAQVAEILANLRKMAAKPMWTEANKPGPSGVGLYWRVWRIEDRPDGFEVLCASCAPTGVVEQLRRDVRPARERDFLYIRTLPPVCARCGWTNEAVMAARVKAHAAEIAWREGGKRG
jgi:hypothetical protein